MKIQLNLVPLFFVCFFLFTSIQIGIAADFKILVFHKTNGFRHTGAINQGITMLEDLGAASSTDTWTVDNTQDASVFTTANLSNYDVIVFLCTSGGGLLNASQKAAMEAFIQGGNGFVGFHSATDTYRNTNANSKWLWYNELVGGIVQTNPYHTPNNTQGTMNVMTNHPTTSHIGNIGDTWVHNEEWYYWEQNGGQVSPNNIVLLEVESTGNNSYDAKRPITWYKEFDGGRSFYTALGHNGSTYQSDQKFRQMSEKAILYAANRINVIHDCTSPISSSWTYLLDEDFTCWEKWMGVPHTTTGLPGSSGNVTNGSGTPLGLNNDPTNVFNIITVNGEKQLYITGEVYGGLTTTNSYSNYHLSMQFKWGTQKWEPRLNDPRDSGILYHCKGNHGTFWDVWKSSLEMQVQEADCGDYIGLAGVGGSILASNNGGWVFDPDNGSLVNVNFVRAEQDLELPNGQWNTLEVMVIGDRAIHYVNGVMVNALQDAKWNGVTVTEGQIQIQSEAAEIYYRDIKIKSLADFPQVDKIRLGWGVIPVCTQGAPIGDTISLKKSGGDENWLTIAAGSSIISADADLQADADLFVVEAHPNGCIAFKSVANGKYIQVNGGNTNVEIKATGNAPGTWENFAWQDMGNDQVAIRSLFNDGWLRADWTIDDVTIFPNGNVNGNFETFDYSIKTDILCDTGAPIGDTISLKKSGGDENWLTITAGSSIIAADADLRADADLFIVEAHPNGCVAFKSVANGKYIQVNGGITNVEIKATGNAPGPWEDFAWKDLGNDQVAIQSLVTGLWLRADWTIDDVSIFPNGTSDSNFETFGYWIHTETVCNIGVWLEGAFDLTSGMMNNNLQQIDLLPTGQPYNIAPWNYNGNEGAGWLPSDYPVGAIDWVLLSLRTSPQPSSEVAKAAALLMEDGTIQPASFELNGNSATAYYIVVEHRNHLPAMTPTAIPLVNNTLNYDFRINNSYNPGAGFGQKQLGTEWVLFAGDISQSSPVGYEVSGADNILWNVENGNFLIYLPEDTNMDGDVNGMDRILLNQNNGISSSILK